MKKVVDIKGETVKGEMYNMTLNDTQRIVGVEAHMCDKYIRGLGFYIWKIGMGIPPVEINTIINPNEERKEH